MTEHTPTPWRVEEGTDLIWGACNPDDQSTYGMGYSIVQGKSGSWGDRKPNMDEREANAAFIVKACNNHDSLVKALERTKKSLIGEFGPRVYEVNFPEIDKALALVAATPAQSSKGE